MNKNYLIALALMSAIYQPLLVVDNEGTHPTQLPKVEQRQTLKTKAQKWLTRATIVLGSVALAASIYFGARQWNRRVLLKEALDTNYMPFPELVLDGYSYDDIMWLLNHDIHVTGPQGQRFGPNWLFEMIGIIFIVEIGHFFIL